MEEKLSSVERIRKRAEEIRAQLGDMADAPMVRPPKQKKAKKKKKKWKKPRARIFYGMNTCK